MLEHKISMKKEDLEKLIQDRIEEFAGSVGLKYDNPSIFHGFNTAATKWDLSNAYVMTRLAILAYQSKLIVKNRLNRSGAELVEWLQDHGTDTQGFICQYQSNLIVCFRGTESFRDARIDANRFQTKIQLPPRIAGKDNKESEGNDHIIGKVHSGFKCAFDSVWTRPVKERLGKILEDDSMKIWIAGHSLGGALATLAASWIAHRHGGDLIRGVYTIGQPRVGDETFFESTTSAFGGEQKTKEKMFRIARSLDPVSQVPYFGYKHFTGTRIYISRSGEVLENPQTLKKWSERIWSYAIIILSLVWSRGKLKELHRLVSDHYAQGYLDALREEKMVQERKMVE